MSSLRFRAEIAGIHERPRYFVFPHPTRLEDKVVVEAKPETVHKLVSLAVEMADTDPVENQDTLLDRVAYASEVDAPFADMVIWYPPGLCPRKDCEELFVYLCEWLDEQGMPYVANQHT